MVLLISKFQMAMNSMIESPLFIGKKNFNTDLLTDLSTRDTSGTELRHLLKTKWGPAG